MKRIVALRTVALMWCFYAFPLQIPFRCEIVGPCGIQRFVDSARKRLSFWLDAKTICGTCTATKRIYRILAIAVPLSGEILQPLSQNELSNRYMHVCRATRKSDLVMPDEARAVAKELGIAYYETSVFTYFGVNEVFENAIRAALIARRHQRFWMTNLKRVQRPLLQVYNFFNF